MKRFYLLLVFSAVVIMAGCAPTYISLRYKAPAETFPQDREIMVSVQDERLNKDVFIASKQDDPHPTIDLFIQTSGQSSKKFNVDPVKAFHEAFTARLASGGVKVTEYGSSQIPLLVIRVEQFEIDRIDGAYRASLAFHADFIRQEKLVRSDRIESFSEHYAITSRRAMEDALSEAFESAVNRLDLIPLF